MPPILRRLGGAGLPVVGGAASARINGATVQFCGTETADAGISGLRLGGRFRHTVAVTHGCAPLTKPLRATQVHENLILELDGRPAFDVLREHAPSDLMQDLSAAIRYLFVGLLPSGAAESDYLIRNIVAADPDTGVVAISDRVEEGRQLVFALRERDAAKRDLAQALDRVCSDAGGSDYQFGLYFNCLARRSRSGVRQPPSRSRRESPGRRALRTRSRETRAASSV